MRIYYLLVESILLRIVFQLMRNPQKHIEMGIRCSLENFGTFASPDGKKIDIIPLYAISNLFAEK